MAERPSRAEPAVFLLSAAVLSFEVLLLRLFAIEHFHHFASMVIGMAMLGFGASGTALVLLRRRLRGRERQWFAAAAVAFTVSLVSAVPLAHAVAFDPTQILWDPRQWRALALVYAALALPFTLGAAALALALMDAGDRVGRVYGANLLGSAFGAVCGIALLAMFRPHQAVAATAIPAAAGAALALLARDDDGLRHRPLTHRAAAVVLLLLALGATARPPWTPRISPFKGLPQVAAFEGARPAGERWGPLGWVVAIRAPSFRHAPGLSLGFTGTLPPQAALFVDGSIAGAATDAAGDDVALEFLRWLPSSTAYAASPSPPRRVLVLGAGDGMDALAALAHGATDVTAAEPNAQLTGLADDVLPPASRVFADSRVTRIASDARTLAARTASTWDLIVLPIAGGFGGATVGGLGEDYGNTVEAYASYLGRLAPGGVLAVTRWVDTPPREATKVLLTAAAALRRHGVAEPGGALAVVRSWAAATLLVKPDGFTAAELERVRGFARSRLFDVDWPPGPTATEFNLLDRPVFTEAARAAAQSSAHAESFARAYPFDIAPPSDDRPWAGRFLRLSSIPSLLATSRGSWLPFAEWGYLALVATLLQSALIAVLLILLPAFVLARRRSLRDENAQRRPPLAMGRSAVYFGAIGGAYLFVEIGLIQKLTLVLGHPVHAAAAVLALCLAFSGAGSLWSDRLAPGAASKAALVAAVAALVVAAALELTPRVQPLPFAGRLAASLLLLAPLAATMGLPFPLGLRRHAGGEQAAVAWAWAVNGFASVVAASLAALVAFEAGIRALLLAGGLLYLLASLAARARPSERSAMTPEPARTAASRPAS